MPCECAAAIFLPLATVFASKRFQAHTFAWPWVPLVLCWAVGPAYCLAEAGWPGAAGQCLPPQSWPHRWHLRYEHYLFCHLDRALQSISGKLEPRPKPAGELNHLGRAKATSNAQNLWVAVDFITGENVGNLADHFHHLLNDKLVYSLSLTQRFKNLALELFQ